VSRRYQVLSLLALLSLSAAPPAVAQDAEPTWLTGPTTVDLGPAAQLALTEDLAFVDGQVSRRLLETWGNTPSNQEVGMVRPTAEDQDWIVIFEYVEEGYIKDDDKDDIDADAILDSYKRGTEESNERRKELGIPGLHVTGWYESPHYDVGSHNLVWGMNAASDDGSQTVNYNIRLLGREGYMSVTLIDEPERLDASRVAVQSLLKNFSYKSGKTYADWVPGDKVAEYGLTALIAGGAGVAAAKLGLFAAAAKFLGKAWKIIIIGLVALGGALKRIFGGGARQEG